ncbi:MAG: 30S ribosomal protein S4 [Oscillospiraceae bacterium]
MARYTGPACKLCRREGQKLFLKGERCYTGKCALERRAYAPGQHGQSRKKASEYAIQLRAKQKTRRYYGVLEGQFAHYFEVAEKQTGVTGENFLIILETRLDNAVYRMGFADSRRQARQLVLHGHFTVNGQKVDIASYLLRVNDVIEVAATSKSNENIKELVANASRVVPLWLDVNRDNMSATVVRLPIRDDVDLDVEEHLIVEYYSK